MYQCTIFRTESTYDEQLMPLMRNRQNCALLINLLTNRTFSDNFPFLNRTTIPVNHKINPIMGVLYKCEIFWSTKIVKIHINYATKNCLFLFSFIPLLIEVFLKIFISKHRKNKQFSKESIETLNFLLSAYC